MVPEERGRVEVNYGTGPGGGTGVAGTVSVTYDDSLATILLGQLAETAISFSAARLESLATALAQLEADVAAGRVRGVVVRSPSPTIFCVGADLNLLDRIQHADLPRVRETLLASPHVTSEERGFLSNLGVDQLPELGAVLARRGQSVFERLMRLPVPKVAAVSGRCLGGGLELALHCDAIVAAAPEPRGSGAGVTTEFGFPEPLLGLLEGWGGIDKTLRRVGLPRGLPLLLEGKPVSPSKALRLGLIDEVVPAAVLYERAAAIARGESVSRRALPLMDRLLTFTGAGRHVVQRGLRLPLVGTLVPGADKALAAFPRENYPAPHAILECALEGLAKGTAAGNELAARRFGELMMSSTAKALVHVTFFGTEAARARGKKTGEAPRHLTCLVVGAGQMGAGIAHALLRAGHKVLVHDLQPAALSKARESLEKWIAEDRQLSADDRAATRASLSFHEQMPKEAADVGFAIEAVVENEGVKQKVLTAIGQAVPASAVIATNTSSIPLARLADAVPSPERFVGVHFFNPVRKMRLVEIVAGPQSSDSALAFGAALVSGLGKFPIVVRDVPGFLINRMLFPYLMEAVHLVCEGVPIDAIDRAAESFGMVMGPLKTIDLVGFDIVRDVGRVIYPAYAERWETPTLSGLAGGAIEWTAVVDHFIASGLLGSKSGAGFYSYGSKPGEKKTKAAEPNSRLSDAAFWAAIGAQAPKEKRLPAAEIVDRLVLALINEAVRMFDEGVAGAPSAEAALQIDLGSVLGFGFAPFRGGVMYYAQELGAAAVAEKLLRLERQHGRRFHAWKGIAARATQGRSFNEPVS